MPAAAPVASTAPAVTPATVAAISAKAARIRMPGMTPIAIPSMAMMSGARITALPG